jgi:hypothetical protein
LQTEWPHSVRKQEILLDRNPQYSKVQHRSYIPVLYRQIFDSHITPLILDFTGSLKVSSQFPFGNRDCGSLCFHTRLTLPLELIVMGCNPAPLVHCIDTHRLNPVTPKNKASNPKKTLFHDTLNMAPCYIQTT